MNTIEIVGLITRNTHQSFIKMRERCYFNSSEKELMPDGETINNEITFIKIIISEER